MTYIQFIFTDDQTPSKKAKLQQQGNKQGKGLVSGADLEMDATAAGT